MLAYLDTFGALVPVRTGDYRTDEQGRTWVEVTVTAPRPAYTRNESFTARLDNLVSRRTRTRNGQIRVTGLTLADLEA
jgi:hypothetical protein